MSCKKVNEQNMKKRILVVDEEPDNCTIFKIALEDNRFELDTFNDSNRNRMERMPNCC